MGGERVEILIVWVALAGLVGWIASTRGRNPLLWGGLALVFSPLLVGIVVLIAGRPAGHAAAPLVGVADELAKLGTLRVAGTITPEEYNAQRARLLPSGRVQAPRGAHCGKCGKLLSPVWRDKCNHCGARYAQYPPSA